MPWHALCLSRAGPARSSPPPRGAFGRLGWLAPRQIFQSTAHPPPLRYRPPGLCACRGRHVGRFSGYCWGWAYQPCAKTPCRTAPQPLWRGGYKRTKQIRYTKIPLLQQGAEQASDHRSGTSRLHAPAQPRTVSPYLHRYCLLPCFCTAVYSPLCWAPGCSPCPRPTPR